MIDFILGALTASLVGLLLMRFCPAVLDALLDDQALIRRFPKE